MSVDDRLRGGLAEQAGSYVPRVEEALDTVRRRGRRARWRATSLTASAGVAAAAAVVAVVVAVTRLDPTPGPAITSPPPPSTASDPQPVPLRGTITADVRSPAALRGSWRLELRGNGEIGVLAAPSGVEVGDAAFTADATGFRTSVFGTTACRRDGTGIYGWTLVSDRVAFTGLSDACAPRETFFTANRWSLSTDPAPGG
jgi:hypothetical protein